MNEKIIQENNKGITKKDLRGEFQRVLVELETYRRQLDAIIKQIQVFEISMSELNSSIEALNSLEKENKPGKEILVSIGSGSYIKAELKDTEKALIGVGAGVFIDKKIKEAKKTLEGRKENLTKVIEDLQKRAVEFRNRIAELNPMAERMAQELRTE